MLNDLLIKVFHEIIDFAPILRLVSHQWKYAIDNKVRLCRYRNIRSTINVILWIKKYPELIDWWLMETNDRLIYDHTTHLNTCHILCQFPLNSSITDEIVETRIKNLSEKSKNFFMKGFRENESVLIMNLIACDSSFVPDLMIKLIISMSKFFQWTKKIQPEIQNEIILNGRKGLFHLVNWGQFNEHKQIREFCLSPKFLQVACSDETNFVFTNLPMLTKVLLQTPLIKVLNQCKSFDEMETICEIFRRNNKTNVDFWTKVLFDSRFDVVRWLIIDKCYPIEDSESNEMDYYHLIDVSIIAQRNFNHLFNSSLSDKTFILNHIRKHLPNRRSKISKTFWYLAITQGDSNVIQWAEKNLDSTSLQKVVRNFVKNQTYESLIINCAESIEYLIKNGYNIYNNKQKIDIYSNFIINAKNMNEILLNPSLKHRIRFSLMYGERGICGTFDYQSFVKNAGIQLIQQGLFDTFQKFYQQYSRGESFDYFVNQCVLKLSSMKQLSPVVIDWCIEFISVIDLSKSFLQNNQIDAFDYLVSQGYLNETMRDGTFIK